METLLASARPLLVVQRGKMIKAIAFDLDGTLIETRWLHYEALNRALMVFGQPPISYEDHIHIYNGLPTKKKLSLLTVKKGLDRSLYASIENEKQKATVELLEKFVPEYTFGNLFKKLLGMGYNLAVCTNSIRKTTDLMIDKLGIKEYVSLVLSNEDVVKSKPCPDMYLEVLRRFKINEEECLVIEDSLHGIQAGLNAGCPVLAVMQPKDVTFELISKVL